MNRVLRGQAFLITEAVRGDGGILRNQNGEAFMERYDERKDLAPRDIVARAIDSEMKDNWYRTCVPGLPAFQIKKNLLIIFRIFMRNVYASELMLPTI